MLNILISGGRDGLGKAIATKLTPANKVIILSHNQEKLKNVSKEIGCDFVLADVTDYSSLAAAVKTVLEKYQEINVLINSAGIWMEGNLEDNDINQIQEVLSVNTLGTIFLTKAVLPSMKSHQQGRIINIISQDGLNAKENRSIYSASKWAITGFTKCLQKDLVKDKIGVMGIYPGLLKTGLFEKQGATRNLDTALDPTEIASIVEYVINLSPDVLIPDISIKNINNPNNMNDSGSPQIGLDLNPDMITPQTGIPQTTPASITPVASPITPGVIDITPGASTSDDLHPEKIENITPVAAVPTPAEAVISENPVTDTGIHLADVVPAPLSDTSLPGPISASPPAAEEAASISVELPPASPINPLHEDPDLVNLSK